MNRSEFTQSTALARRSAAARDPHDRRTEPRSASSIGLGRRARDPSEATHVRPVLSAKVAETSVGIARRATTLARPKGPCPQRPS